MFKDSGLKNHEEYGFGTINLKFWVLGPSGNDFLSLTDEETNTKLWILL